MKNWTIGKRITLGFACSVAVALLLGAAGYYGSLRSESAVRVLGKECLPAVQCVEEIRLGGEQVKTAQRTLMNLDLDAATRKRQYENLAQIRTNYEVAWKEFETLPKSPEEEALWQNLGTAWGDWRKANTEFFQTMKQVEDFNLGNPLRLSRAMERYQSDHYKLVARVQDMLQTKHLFEGGEDPAQCAFGKWKAEQKIDNNEIRNTLAEMDQPHRRFHEAVKKVKELVRNDDIAAATTLCQQEIMAGSGHLVAWFGRMDKQASQAEQIFNQADTQLYQVCRPLQSKANDLMDKLVTYNQETAARESNRALAQAHSLKILSVSLMVAGVVLCVALAVFTIRSTTKPIKAAAAMLSTGAEQTASAAGQVSSASQTLAEGASEQAASLEETSSSLEEMASMTKRNSENAQKANDLAKEARVAADRGAGDMQSMSSAMEAIKVSSDDIAKIIKTIDEIAFQTNILALNAAVEAARAGEAGMGFAVVADEVRSLAQRSAQAAKETASKIEGAITKTGQGVEISTKVAQALNDIVSKVRQVDELVAEVSGASREQTQGITQINMAVGQMDKVTQSNAASAEESAAAAEELNAQAETMKQSVTDLMRLVGGSQQTIANGTPAPTRAKETHTAKLARKRSVSARSNGHTHAAPAVAAAASPKEPAMAGASSLPLPDDNDFKDF